LRKGGTKNHLLKKGGAKNHLLKKGGAKNHLLKKGGTKIKSRPVKKSVKIFTIKLNANLVVRRGGFWLHLFSKGVFLVQPFLKRLLKGVYVNK